MPTFLTYWKECAQSARKAVPIMAMCGVLLIGAPLSGCDWLDINGEDSEEESAIPSPPEPPQSSDPEP